MTVDATRASVVATQLKRQTTNKDVLDLCEFVLSASKTIQQFTDAASLRACPVCNQRKAAKAASMRRWRAKDGNRQASEIKPQA